MTWVQGFTKSMAISGMDRILVDARKDCRVQFGDPVIERITV